MSTTITADNAGIVLHSAVSAAKSAIPNTSSFGYPQGSYRMCTKVKVDDEYDYDRVWDKILDCYELSATIRDRSPLPFLLDPDGTTVVELENIENLLRKGFDKLISERKGDDKAVKVVQAAIDILQNLRWEILVNDGMVEEGRGEYNDARSFMASMGL